jgi:hypothetical protein
VELNAVAVRQKSTYKGYHSHGRTVSVAPDSGVIDRNVISPCSAEGDNGAVGIGIETDLFLTVGPPQPLTATSIQVAARNAGVFAVAPSANP